MLFQVTLLATLVAQPLLPALTLNPQLEADDEDEARAELDHWLAKTGYQVTPGNVPDFQLVDSESGLSPEIAAVNALADENAALKDQLAEVQSGGDGAKLAESEAGLKMALEHADRLTVERDDYRQKATDLLAALDATKDEVAKLTTASNGLGELVQQEAQKVADRDSQIATLQAQLTEALKPSVVNPPAAVPATPASPPADGSTPTP